MEKTTLYTRLFTRGSLSKILSITAFLASLFWRDLPSTLLQICIAATGLYFFITTLPVSRIPELEDARNFPSVTSVLVFLVTATLTKLVVPLLMLTDDNGLWFSIVGVYLSFVLALYWLWNRSVWKKYKQALKEHIHDIKLRARYNRVINSIGLLSLVIGLDGPDLMFLLNLLFSFLNEISMLIIALKSASSKLLTRFLRKTRIEKKHDFHKKRALDFDDWLWSRALYSKILLKGVPMLMFAFVAFFPFIVFSYQIDFFNLDPLALIGMIVFSTPGIVAILAIRIPWKIGRGRGIIWRKRMLALSFLPPVLTVIAGNYIPNLKFDAPIPPIILLCFTGLIGLPLLRALIFAEQDNYHGFIKWFKILGVSTLPLFILAAIYALGASSISESTFSLVVILYLYISLFGTSIIYIILIHALYVQFEEGYKELDNKEVDSLIRRIFVPGFNLDTLISVVGIGALQAPLSLLMLGFEDLVTLFLNALLSFAAGFAVGWILQRRSEQGSYGALSIAVLHFSSFFLSIVIIALDVLTKTEISPSQLLSSVSHLFAFTATWAIPIGTTLAFIVLRRGIARRSD